MPGVLRALLPALDGSTEQIPEKVWGAQREEWKKLERRETMLNDPGVRDTIIAYLHKRTEMPVEIILYAQKRWSDKAAKALLYLSQGETEKEASKRAGISDRTLRNHLTWLKKDLFLKS